MSALLRGYRRVSPAERGVVGLLSAFALTIAISRGINFMSDDVQARWGLPSSPAPRRSSPDPTDANSG